MTTKRYVAVIGQNSKGCSSCELKDATGCDGVFDCEVCGKICDRIYPTWFHWELKEVVSDGNVSSM